MPVLENIETIGYFTELFRADYEGMTEGDINTMMEAYLYGGEFVHESHHPFGNFISGILDVTIVKPLIECVIGKDLITGDKLTEFEQGMQFVDVLIGVLTLGQGATAMKHADLTGKDAAKQLLKVWAVDAVSDTAAYTAGYVCDELGMPPGVTFIASLLTGCTVSLEVGKYVFRDGGKIVKQLDADEMLEYVGGGGKGGLEPGTLSNVDARKWYLEQEAKIPDLIDDSLPLEQQARQAFELRNQFRKQARELMSDRQLAESLCATDPNLTWEQIIQKQIDKGLSRDDIYKAIIESSQRSRTSVNQSLGLE